MKGANVQMEYLEYQKDALRDQIKAGPLIRLIDKDGKPRGQWKEGVSCKITASKEEIQNRIYYLLSQD